MTTSGQSLSREEFSEYFHRIKHRGPDVTKLIDRKDCRIGFHRLAIMDPSSLGDQPFHGDGCIAVCNGEIYNYTQLKQELAADFHFQSHSDCEVLLPLYLKGGISHLLDQIEGEFALVIYDGNQGKWLAARDPLGIRPLFYGYDAQGGIAFASEMKALNDFCEVVKPFPPGHFYDGASLQSYFTVVNSPVLHTDFDVVVSELRQRLIQAVSKRLHADSPIGFLLSGGLDSSLVCAIAQKQSSTPIRTFAIGMEHDAIDLGYARQVADFLGTNHTEIIITKDDVKSHLRQVIYCLESYDITTIRASVGMYLLCQKIRETTNIKVLLTGEVSDELFGYKYTDYAPSAAAFQQEAEKRVSELYMYDVLRADRCISAHGLEARVPFSDRQFVEYAMSIQPELKMNGNGVGKFLLRTAFSGLGFLPESILWREKAAFSDAVGHSLVDELKAFAEVSMADHPQVVAQQFSHATPFTTEALFYRMIFSEFYPDRCQLISGYWMPNKDWENCNVDDPSARVLANYGTSGRKI